MYVDNLGQFCLKGVIIGINFRLHAWTWAGDIFVSWQTFGFVAAKITNSVNVVTILTAQQQHSL